MPNTINSLILRIARRDNEALSELYQEMRKPVYYYALHFCGSHEIAEDVMQDTFITVWSKSGSFIPKGSGRAWILSIAKNKTLNIIKQNRRLCAFDQSEDLIVSEDCFLNAFEAKSVLNDLLRTLTGRESDIVMLRHVVGLSLTEIAKEKNMKKGTVFWTYNNAIKKLRKTLERIEHDEE